MVECTFVKQREAGAGEMVRDGILAEWRLAWVMRGAGEYVRRGESAVVGPGWVVAREKGARDAFVWEDYEDARWTEIGIVGLARGARGLGAKVREGEVLGPMLSWVWGNREKLKDAAMGAMVGAIWEVVALGEAGTREPPSVVLPAVVERALVWMRAKLADNPRQIFSNADIARAAGCSVPWIQFLFKRHFGWYPVQMARRARLDRAVELLKETELPVAVVAGMCGFVSPSHLSRHLRTHLGADASTVRRKARAGEWAGSRLAGLVGTARI